MCPRRRQMCSYPATLSVVLPVVLVLAGLLYDPSTQTAKPTRVEELRIVVAPTSGSLAFGRKPLTRGLREALVPAVGQLVRTKRVLAARRRLGLKGRKAHALENLTKLGRRTRAHYVIHLAIEQSGYLYAVRTRLIRTQDAQVLMNFVSRYYAPKTEARDRGHQIAENVLAHLRALYAPVTDENEGLAKLVAPKPEPRPNREPPPNQPVSSSEDALQPASQPNPSLAVRAPPSSTTTRAEAPPIQDVFTKKPQTHKIELSMTAGAGLVHQYELSANSIGRSALSYTLDPQSLLDLRGLFELPIDRLLVDCRVAFRPVSYSVQLSGEQQPVEPGGFLIDAQAALSFRIPLSSRGAQLRPTVGARTQWRNIDDHPTRALLNSQTASLFGGMIAIVPIHRAVDLRSGIDAGPILIYNESPGRSGQAGVGITVGGDLGFRIWLTPTWALAIDSRYTYDRIPFEGSPERAFPQNEVGQVRNADIEISDLRASIGVAIRI